MADRASHIIRTRLDLKPLDDTQLFFWLLSIVEKQDMFISLMYGASLVRLESTVWYTVITKQSDGQLLAGDCNEDLIESLCGCFLKALMKGAIKL